MSAQEALAGAVLAALEAHAPLAEALNGVHAAPPVRATPPWALVGEMIVQDWSTKTEAGRDIRFRVAIFEEAERAGRLGGLMAGAESAIEAMERDLAGWRIASLVFQRARIVRGEGPWRAEVEYRARMLGA